MKTQKLARDFVDESGKRRGITLDKQTWLAVDWLADRASAKWPELFQAWAIRDEAGARVNLTAVIRAGIIADLMDATIVAPRLDDDSIELLRRVENLTGMSPAKIIKTLWPSHLEELFIYVEWLEELAERPGKARNLGRYLLQSHGPETLIEGIKRLDPTYEIPSEKLAAKRAKSDKEASTKE